MRNEMLVNVILDRSGSMGGLVEDVIKNYNNYINELKNMEGTIHVSLVQFDDQYEEVYLNRDVHSVPRLTGSTYFARGSTSLLDAIGRTIKAVESLAYKPEKIIFAINTDGFENSSVEFTRPQIKELVESKQAAGWQFIFMGAGIDAITEGSRVGIYYNNTLSTSNTARGYNYNFTVLSNYSGMAMAAPSASSVTLADAIEATGSEDTFDILPTDTVDQKINKRARRVKTK